MDADDAERLIAAIERLAAAAERVAACHPDSGELAEMLAHYKENERR